MSTICLNCGTEITDKYCPHCGQKKDVEKLTWHSLLHEIFHFFSHIERGFLNTSYQLLIRPGRVIREYLEGKRKKYHKPIGFYLIWVAIFILTRELILHWMNYAGSPQGNFLFFATDAGNYFAEHRNFFEFLLMPIMAFFTWLIITRPKLNYLETLVMVIYVFAVFQILIILQLIIIGLLMQINFRNSRFEIEVVIVDFAWAFFCFIDFYKKEKIKLLPLRYILSSVISFLIYYKIGAFIVDLILRMKH